MFRSQYIVPCKERKRVLNVQCAPLFLQGQDLSKLRKELILKLVSSLLEGPSDTNLLPEMSPEEAEEPLRSRLEERAVYNRLSLPQRDRKAPCKNFFWKTFTSC